LQTSEYPATRAVDLDPDLVVVVGDVKIRVRGDPAVPHRSLSSACSVVTNFLTEACWPDPVEFVGVNAARCYPALDCQPPVDADALVAVVGVVAVSVVDLAEAQRRDTAQVTVGPAVAATAGEGAEYRFGTFAYQAWGPSGGPGGDAAAFAAAAAAAEALTVVAAAADWAMGQAESVDETLGLLVAVR